MRIHLVGRDMTSVSKIKGQRREESCHAGGLQRHEISSSLCLAMLSVEFLNRKESTAVLSDRICRAKTIDDGSLE